MACIDIANVEEMRWKGGSCGFSGVARRRYKLY